MNTCLNCNEKTKKIFALKSVIKEFTDSIDIKVNSKGYEIRKLEIE